MGGSAAAPSQISIALRGMRFERGGTPSPLDSSPSPRPETAGIRTRFVRHPQPSCQRLRGVGAGRGRLCGRWVAPGRFLPGGSRQGGCRPPMTPWGTAPGTAVPDRHRLGDVSAVPHTPRGSVPDGRGIGRGCNVGGSGGAGFVDGGWRQEGSFPAEADRGLPPPMNPWQRRHWRAAVGRGRMQGGRWSRERSFPAEAG